MLTLGGYMHLQHKTLTVGNTVAINKTTTALKAPNQLVYLYGGDRAKEHHLTSLTTGIVARKNDGGPRVGTKNRSRGDDVLVITNLQQNGMDCFCVSWGFYNQLDVNAKDPFNDPEALYERGAMERVDWVVKAVMVPKHILPTQSGRSYSNPNDNGKNARAILDYIKTNCFWSSYPEPAREY
jgi:hypothetical protein